MTPFIPIAIIALAFAATGCNATGATPTRPAPVTPAPAVSTPTALRGAWTADVQGTTASSGLWTMTVSESNVLLQNPVNGDLFSIRPTSVTATSMVLAADADCPDQASVTPGTYTLALSGDTLTITLVSDSCVDRSGVLASGPWTRQP